MVSDLWLRRNLTLKLNGILIFFLSVFFSIPFMLLNLLIKLAHKDHKSLQSSGEWNMMGCRRRGNLLKLASLCVLMKAHRKSLLNPSPTDRGSNGNTIVLVVTIGNKSLQACSQTDWEKWRSNINRSVPPVQPYWNEQDVSVDERAPRRRSRSLSLSQQAI